MLVNNLNMQPSKWRCASLEAGKKSLLTKSYMRTLVILSLVSTTGNLLLVFRYFCMCFLLWEIK